MPFEALCFIWHTFHVRWTAYFHPRFKAEFDELAGAVQDELLASLVPLREYGPSLGRPEVDTLNDSKYANMKELRFKADGGVHHTAHGGCDGGSSHNDCDISRSGAGYPCHFAVHGQTVSLCQKARCPAGVRCPPPFSKFVHETSNKTIVVTYLF
jgi:hypothetical protein